MTAALGSHGWPMSRLGEAVQALAQAVGVAVRESDTPSLPADLEPDDRERIDVWMEQAAAWVGVELEAVQAPYAEASSMIRGVRWKSLQILQSGYFAS